MGTKAHDGPLGRRQQHGDRAQARSPRWVAAAVAQTPWVAACPSRGNGSLVTSSTCSLFFAGCCRWNQVMPKYTRPGQRWMYFLQV